MTVRGKALVRLRAIRNDAMARPELRRPTNPRVPPASPTSMAVKAVDPQTRAMIDAAVKARAAP